MLTASGNGNPFQYFYSYAFPVKPGEKHFIDFNFHYKGQAYTWEYNINLLNWRHRYTGIGTVEF